MHVTLPLAPNFSDEDCFGQLKCKPSVDGVRLEVSGHKRLDISYRPALNKVWDSQWSGSTLFILQVWSRWCQVAVKSVDPSSWFLAKACHSVPSYAVLRKSPTRPSEP